MLLDALVVVVALTGAFAGVLALALYLVDRRLVRTTMAEGRAFLAKAKAALDVPGKDGSPIPPLQVMTSIATTALTNAAYILLEDPEVMTKVKPVVLEALPAIAEGYARGANAPQENPGVALNRKRWGDRGGKAPKLDAIAEDPWKAFQPMIMDMIMQKMAGAGGGPTLLRQPPAGGNGSGVIKW